ncbi:MAG: hydantoinase B/oxoprolinase family protein [Actinomycetota bacterium]
MTPNPVTLEIVRNALYSIAEEMRIILMRSARAPLLKEAGDLSCALTDAAGRLLAEGKDIPMHLGVMAFTVQEFLMRIPRSELRPGDVYFLNLPEVGGNHLPDVKAITPVFFDDALVAFAINLAHWADVGGALAGSYVTTAVESYQEGLRISPTRVFTSKGADRNVLELILSNVRGREEREGDIFAQYACNDVAGHRLGELFAEHSRDVALACFDRLLDESEELMREGIRGIPAGVYEGEDYLDDDGITDAPIRIAVRAEIRGDEATFDFAGSSPQVAGPLNTTYFITCSSVYYCLKALVGETIPPNAGCYRPIRVRAPSGTVVNAGPLAAVVGGNHETSQRIVDAIFKALSPVLPDRITAGGSNTSGLTLMSGRTPSGQVFVLYEVYAGGEGASQSRDGTNAVRVHMTNVMNTPVEAVEGAYPLRIEEYALISGSGGAGEHRGGLGLRRSYRILADEVKLTTMIERRRFPPWGVFGGKPGRPFRIHINPDGRDPGGVGKGTFRLRRGDRVVVESAGGGGYGDERSRAPEPRERDAAEGYAAETGPPPWS